MTVSVELTVNGSGDGTARYVTWCPAPCSLRVVDADGASGEILVTLRNRAGRGGKLVFRRLPSGPVSDHLELPLSSSGAPSEFFVSGEFGSPSLADGDAAIQIRKGSELIGSVPIMVRIRKNAETLTSAERGRFLSALARLNDHGVGPFRSFRATHTEDTVREAHGNAAFMPWHRGYMLDLERELQKLDPSVTLPYWRFDQPSPKLFASNFLGAPDPSTGLARFTAANPLTTWSTDGVVGIERLPYFDTRTSAASNADGPVAAERVTVGSSAAYGPLRRVLESNPHGRAHVSFSGVISQIGTAARDPLFFLLHCNVDRLWAKWQWFQKRFDPQTTRTYEFLGSATSPDAARIGHNLKDTMWPWNNITGGDRPNTAPRTPFPASPTTAAPGFTPDVRAMIDYQGHTDPAKQLGFDYDDVPYEPLAP